MLTIPTERRVQPANVLPKRRPRSWSVDQIVPYFGCILEALYGKILGKDKACDGIFSFKRTSPFPPFQKCQRQRMEYQRSTTIDLLSQGLGRGLVDRWQTRSSTERHSLPRALVKISFGQQIINAQIKKMIWWANTSQWQAAPTQPLQETWSLQVDRIIVKLKLQYFLQQCEVNMVCYNKGLLEAVTRSTQGVAASYVLCKATCATVILTLRTEMVTMMVMRKRCWSKQ